MAKLKTVYICQECGIEVSKWVGRCPSCGAWNSIVEHKVSKSNKSKTTDAYHEKSKPQLISDIKLNSEHRIISGINEFDRIIGGGFVPGSVILIGGEPGIGKS
ncbi:MAG: DNA repair protein RadA, partial [Bacteroidota bacterium]|nr:DNA repair protein RadA [Bacteroidota bacterium]